MNILWISACAPYDTVPHAGGKNHNFYLKQIFKKNHNLELLSFYSPNEKIKLDLDKYGIKNQLICRDSNPKTIFEKIKHRILLHLFQLNPFSQCLYYNNSVELKQAYRKVRKSNFFEQNKLDIIILQWTEMVLLLPKLKKIFPSAKFVTIEEDVFFLASYRRWYYSTNVFKKILSFIEYKRVKRLEKKCLELADLVILNNYKDYKLLDDNGIVCNKVVNAPFYMNMSHIKSKHSGKDILFYGAMCRTENYQSAIWFIENVFPKLEPLGYRFVVLGNKPHESLKKFDNGKSICVTGFVDDITPYFENSLCLVAPLVLGAGIKIKILEAMSSGLPVLTNEIGIEGINAVNERDYFFCKTPEDYERRILGLSENPDIGIKMDSMAKKFVKEQFNYERDADRFYYKLINL